jgi:hypothetical protein
MIADLESQLEHALEEAKVLLGGSEQPEYHLQVPEPLAAGAREVSRHFDGALVRIAALVRESPMLGSVDLEAIQLALRRVDAALRLRAFKEWGECLLYDEDVVRGVRSPGFSEDRISPHEALAEIVDALDAVKRRLGVLHAQAEAEAAGVAIPAWPSPSASSPGVNVQPGTAFIMMMIDRDKPELEDVKQGIKEEFARFGIKAIRADDIQHSDETTLRVLGEIRSSEFLIADLTGERPSVYYEVGYAHAIGKRPILYCRAGTSRHFDLKVHNCPAYANVTELRQMLRQRLAAMTGRE